MGRAFQTGILMGVTLFGAGLFGAGRPVPYQADTARDTASPPAEHPLIPALRIAHAAYKHICHDIRDYTCILVKRERVGNRLIGPQIMFAKVRHEQRENGRVVTPYSVYLRFLKPAELKGREVLYVRGRNHGKLIARKGGKRFAYVTVALDPTNKTAMKGNRYAVTEFGIKNTVKRLIEVGEKEIKRTTPWSDYHVEIFRQAKINARVCTAISIVCQRHRENSRFHHVRIYVDDQRQVPLRYEAYGFPVGEGEDPPLLEEYTYLKLQLNAQLNDADFQKSTYGFPEQLGQAPP